MDKQKYVEMAEKILSGTLKPEERILMEDELVELAYKIANELEITPEELEVARDDRREKEVGLGNKQIKEVGSVFMKANKKAEVVEGLGDILEIVETYTARV